MLSTLSWELRGLEEESLYLGKIKLSLIKTRIIIPVLIVDISLMTDSISQWKPRHTQSDAAVPKKMNFAHY